MDEAVSGSNVSGGKSSLFSSMNVDQAPTMCQGTQK